MIMKKYTWNILNIFILYFVLYNINMCKQVLYTRIAPAILER